MAHTKSARKRVLVNERRRLRNRHYRSTSRTLVRRAEAEIASGDIEAAEEAVNQAIQTLDRTADKGIIHKNNAARRKSRLMAKFNKMGSQQTS